MKNTSRTRGRREVLRGWRREERKDRGGGRKRTGQERSEEGRGGWGRAERERGGEERGKEEVEERGEEERESMVLMSCRFAIGLRMEDLEEKNEALEGQVSQEEVEEKGEAGGLDEEKERARARARARTDFLLQLQRITHDMEQRLNRLEASR
eukprot:766804-Hanusia_phi.AAC.3